MAVRGRPGVAFDFGMLFSWASGPAGLRVLVAAREVRAGGGFVVCRPVARRACVADSLASADCVSSGSRSSRG
jgi:hypothetical protein